MKFARVLVIAVLMWMPSTAFASDNVMDNVMIGMLDGRISLLANNVTIGEILAEWSRIGQTQFVNIDRIAGNRMTLELINVSEEQALEILLKSANGYVAAPRATFAAHLSRYDRIVIMPSATAAASVAARVEPPPPAEGRFVPLAQRNRFIPRPAQSDNENGDDRFQQQQVDPEVVADEPPPNGAPVFSAFPRYPLARPTTMIQENVPDPDTTPPTSPVPNSVPSVPRGSMSTMPGVIVQPPATPPRIPPRQ